MVEDARLRDVLFLSSVSVEYKIVNICTDQFISHEAFIMSLLYLYRKGTTSQKLPVIGLCFPYNSILYKNYKIIALIHFMFQQDH